MQNAPETRASLLLRMRESQDEQAWQDFVEIYGPLITRLARRYGLQAADASDVSQDVLTRVAKAVQSWDPDPARGSFRGWLTRVTRNLTIEWFRSRQRRPLTNPDSQQLDLAAAPWTEDCFDWEQRRALFHWAAQKARPLFADNTWQAFCLTAIDQLSPSAAAEQLGISVGAVYIARSRVMARIREIVLRSEFDPEGK